MNIILCHTLFNTDFENISGSRCVTCHFSDLYIYIIIFRRIIGKSQIHY